MRDRMFRATRLAGSKAKTLPKSADLRSGCPAVYDQGDLGSCTANAIASGGGIRPAQAEDRAAVHAVAAVHLLQRARD